MPLILTRMLSKPFQDKGHSFQDKGSSRCLSPLILTNFQKFCQDKGHFVKIRGFQDTGHSTVYNYCKTYLLRLEIKTRSKANFDLALKKPHPTDKYYFI